MQKHIDYEKIEKSAKFRKKAGNVLIYTLLTLWAILVLFPLLDAFNFHKKLRLLQRGVHSQVFHPVAHAAKLCGRFYHSIPRSVPLEHTAFHRDNHGAHAGCHYPGGIRFCKTGF